MRQNGAMKRDTGFTLIEVLVVVGIIGILAALAFSDFSELKGKGLDARAKSDLRNVANGEEAYFSQYEVYKSCDTVSCPASLPGLESISAGVTLAIVATASGFTGTATHNAGGGVTFNWNSSDGGLQ